MQTNPPWAALLVAVSALTLAQSANAGIIHRYSFSETSGTVVSDSAGTADGELKGNNGFFDGAGHLTLGGGTGSAATPDVIAGYVDLPNHIINVLTNLTIEAWVDWESPGGGDWQRIFDFGTSQGGEDVSDGNGNYLFLSPEGPDGLRFAVRDPVSGAEVPQLTAPFRLEPQTGNYVCVTVTYDTTANVSRLYTNGVLIVSGPASLPLSAINDVNNWLGRSQWNDTMFQGNYDEFRIYDNALTVLEVAASYVGGVAQPTTDPAVLGPVTAVNLTVPQLTMTEQDTQTASGTADFANISGIALNLIPGVTFTSGNTAVLTVDATGLVTAVSPGITTLTLSYQGMTDVETITVNARQTGVVVAGSLFVDLRAADVSTDVTTWPNRAGTGDFTAVGAPVYVADVNGTGVAAVQFNPATPATDAYAGPASTPEIDGTSDCSIEVWAYNPAIAAEETLVSWSHRGGAPDGSNMSFNYGSDGAYGAAGHWGSADLGWSGAPAAGQWHYLVYTFDGLNTDRVYADGLQKNSETPITLNVHAGFPIRIGAQAIASGDDFDFGQAFSGYIAMVRVHTGQLSANDVANNYLYGPTLTAPGALQTVNLTADRLPLTGVRDIGAAQMVASFANLPNVNVTGFSAFESSDTNVVTVDASGVYTAVSLGTATITGTFQGRPATQVISVVAPPPLELKHRYSFSEAAGSTTVEDLVGTADGVTVGQGAVFDGNGKLSVAGGGQSGTPLDTSGYVNLPNHIINTLVNASFEVWVTWDATAPSTWQRIFDLGTSGGGEDVADGGGGYLFLSPQGDTNLRFAARHPWTGAEPTQLTASTPLPQGTEVYIAVSYDYTGNSAVLYTNAVPASSGPAMVPLHLINDVNNWLGRSQWNDNMFQGTYNEFRIWEGALAADQVAAAYAAGPNQLPDVSPAPTMTASLSGTSLVLSWPASATGFALQSTVLLVPATWGTEDISGAVNQGGQMVLTLPINSATKFYRMRK